MNYGMLKSRLRHKINGEIIDCIFKFGINGKRIYYNPNNQNEIYNIEEYDIIPLYPYELFGIECKEGWKELYEPIIKYVKEYNKDKNDNDKIIIRQIKEKWAHLEFSFNFYTDELSNMTSKAYKESENVCECCGSKDDVGIVIGGYYHTICLKCLLEELKEFQKKCYWRRSSDKTVFLVDTDGTMEEQKEKRN